MSTSKPNADRDLLADIEQAEKAYQNPTPELIEAERKMQEFERTHRRLFRVNESGECETDFAEDNKKP